MKKSRLFSLMMVAVLVFSLCSNAFAADETVTITYCNFNASGGNEETLDKMVAAFEAEFPNIKHIMIHVNPAD